VQTTHNIKTAYIPVLKIQCNETFYNKRLDFTVNEQKHNGLNCVKLLNHFLEFYPCLKPLTYVLKHFIYSLGQSYYLTYKGGLSSYGLILMIVTYLQVINFHAFLISSNISRSQCKMVFIILDRYFWTFYTIMGL